jgi:hypothetical protein
VNFTFEASSPAGSAAAVLSPCSVGRAFTARAETTVFGC